MFKSLATGAAALLALASVPAHSESFDFELAIEANASKLALTHVSTPAGSMKCDILGQHGGLKTDKDWEIKRGNMLECGLPGTSAMYFRLTGNYGGEEQTCAVFVSTVADKGIFAKPDPDNHLPGFSCENIAFGSQYGHTLTISQK